MNKNENRLVTNAVISFSIIYPVMEKPTSDVIHLVCNTALIPPNEVSAIMRV